jgi:hypothetical protein
MATTRLVPARVNVKSFEETRLAFQRHADAINRLTVGDLVTKGALGEGGAAGTPTGKGDILVSDVDQVFNLLKVGADGAALVLNSAQALGVEWTAPTPAAHAASHEVGGSDLVDHDNLTNFVANKHIDHSAVLLNIWPTNDETSVVGGGQDITQNRGWTVGIADSPIIPGAARIRLPSGVEGARPDPATNAEMRYNTTTNRFEGYENGAWVDFLDKYTQAEVDALLHAEAHTIASHSDTTATGAELETLTDGSNADALHVHSASGITTGTLAHERGGIEADISGVAIGDFVVGTGAGTMGLVTSAGHNDGDVMTRQADGSADWEAPAGGGGGDTHPIADSTAIVKDPADATKLVRVDAGAITTGNTRVINMADQDVSLTPNTGTYPAAAHKTRHQSGGADAIKLDDLVTPDDNTDLNVSTSAHGLCPKLPNTVGKYLDGQGNYLIPNVNLLSPCSVGIDTPSYAAWNKYSTSGGRTLGGIGILITTAQTATLHLAYLMPPVIPAGQATIRWQVISANTAGTLLFNPSWNCHGGTGDFDVVTLNAEGTQTITFSTVDEVEVASHDLDHGSSTMVASGILYIEVDITSTVSIANLGHLLVPIVTWE